MTDFERACKLKEILHSVIDLTSDKYLVDNNYYQEVRKYFIEKHCEKVPIFIIDLLR